MTDELAHIDYEPSSNTQPEPKLAGDFRMISLDLIDDPEAAMRDELTPASVEDLVLSIKQVGLIEPVILKPNNGRFEVIAGHRRTYASRLAKLAEIPCHIRTTNDEETEMLKIHENLYRADVSPAEEARYYESLIKKHKLNPNRIATLVGRGLTYVTERLAILEWPDHLVKAMTDGKISFSVAKEFSKFGDDQQIQTAIYYSIRSGMTQSQARKWVQDWKHDQEHAAFAPQPLEPTNGNAQAIEHSATCIYCGNGLRLIEAEVVYMHSGCMNEAVAMLNQPEPQPTPETPQ